MSQTRYTGRQFIAAAVGGARDVLQVVLEPKAEYTRKEVDRIVDKLLNKEVKG